MSDVRDWGAFIRGRWDWRRFKYDRGFPRGCTFSDIDAITEFNGHKLYIESKSFDPDDGGAPPEPMRGQRLMAEAIVREDETANYFFLYGCGVCNDPFAVYDVRSLTWHKWVGEDRAVRREHLKGLIDRAMGLWSE